jgi:hypothetical protein
MPNPSIKAGKDLGEEEKEKSVWGPLIFTPWDGEDNTDPIQQLINEYDSIKSEKWLYGTKEEFDREKKDKLQKKEKEIYDAIKFKKMKVHQ